MISETLTSEDSVQQKVDSFAGRISLFAKNLETGVAFGLGADTRVQTASTIKVAIMAAAYAEVAAGRVAWDDALTLTEAGKAYGAGVLRELSPGLRLTLRDAVHLMIVVSDNTATNLVLDRITSDVVNELMDTLGLPAIRSLRHVGGAGGSRANDDPANAGFGLGVATPRAMVALMERLERGQVVSAEASGEMIALLKRQQHRDGIGRGAADGVEVANKPGALDLLRSDVGILYTPGGRIAMAITCDGLPRVFWSVDNPAQVMIAWLSETLAAGLGRAALVQEEAR